MSRIGRKPIEIPQGTTASINDSAIALKGPKGELSHTFPSSVIFNQKDNMLKVTVKDENDRTQRAFWGLARALTSNMVEGVSKGFEKKLEIQGVGYKAEMKGTTLVLNVGYSHTIEMTPLEGITITVEKNIISISGINKQIVGEMAANIRKTRKPEPYKGKGIRYVGEQVRRKAGKVVKASE